MKKIVITAGNSHKTEEIHAMLGADWLNDQIPAQPKQVQFLQMPSLH